MMASSRFCQFCRSAMGCFSTSERLAADAGAAATAGGVAGRGLRDDAPEAGEEKNWGAGCCTERLLKLEATVRIAAHPFGDLGGALSWPAPLDQNQQTQLRLLAMNHAHHLGDQPQVTQTKSVLDFSGAVLASNT